MITLGGCPQEGYYFCFNGRDLVLIGLLKEIIIIQVNGKQSFLPVFVTGCFWGMENTKKHYSDKLFV